MRRLASRPVAAVLVALTVALTCWVLVAPRPARAATGAVAGGAPMQVSTTALPATSPSTLVAPIGGRLPVAPATVPLQTRGSNAHVSPVFPILSGVGFALALVIAGARLVVTRPGGKDRRPLGDRPA